MVELIAKVGIIVCSGEEIPEGTISRLATRRVLEALRPQHTVTLCLPLFLAGEEGERRFAREHPTITVDGCSKLCAKIGTEKYSGKVGASLVVSEILGDRVKGCRRSIRPANPADAQAVWIVAERIAAEVDALLATGFHAESAEPVNTGVACCSCNSIAPEGNLQIEGKSVTLNGLPLIFQHHQKKGLLADEFCGDQLLETARIYHPIEPGDEPAYRNALRIAYQAFCKLQTNSIPPS
jgi:uncharacterized metal-binding protein